MTQEILDSRQRTMGWRMWEKESSKRVALLAPGRARDAILGKEQLTGSSIAHLGKRGVFGALGTNLFKH